MKHFLHDIKMTAGQVNRLTNEVEPPWKCAKCGKYFHRFTKAATCLVDDSVRSKGQ